MKSMKSLCVFAFACALLAQTAPAPAPTPMPALPDDTVIATFEDGVKFTMGEFKQVYGALSLAQQQSVMRDRSEFLHQLGMMRKMTKLAEERKLAEQSPYKEALEQQRMQLLSQALVNDTLNTFVIEPGEIVKHYEANKSKYGHVKVKAIYIAYTDDASAAASKGKKRTEADAKAKAEKLLAQIRAGGDFVKLVKENSEDDTSREKNGDFATLHFSDNIPDTFRAAIFKLKQGETTEPLKQPNGYYLLRAEEVSYKALAEVRDDIYNELKNQRFADWMAKLNRETDVKVNPAFTGTAGK
jgi:peptidyl-prolyl cis-trans isomerase C